MVPPQLTSKQKALIVLGVLLFSVLMVLILWYLFAHPLFTNNLRDVSIIFLAITVIVLDVILIVMIYQVIRLLEFLLVELKPVLDDVQQTTSTVRGTAGFVSEGVSSPLIDASSKAAAVKGSIGFVVGSVLMKFSKGGGSTRSGAAPAGAPAESTQAAGRASQPAGTQETTPNV
jgi:hypothetical protein